MTLHQLPDHGFADADAALIAVRRMKLRQKLRDAHASIARALEHLDVVAQPDRSAAPAGSDQRVDLTVGGGKGYVGEVGFFDRDSQRMRERELLEGLDAVNELLDLAAVEIRHGLFSSKRGSASAADGGAGQSLCRGAEKTPPESGAGGAA